MEVLVTGGDTDLGRTVAEGFRDAGHRVVIAGSRRDDGPTRTTRMTIRTPGRDRKSRSPSRAFGDANLHVPRGPSS